MVGVVQALLVINTTGSQMMQTPEDVAQMLRLKAAGLGIKHIARKMGCSKNTVRRYLRGGGWVAYKRPERKRTLCEFEMKTLDRIPWMRREQDVNRIRAPRFRVFEAERNPSRCFARCLQPSRVPRRHDTSAPPPGCRPAAHWPQGRKAPSKPALRSS